MSDGVTDMMRERALNRRREWREKMLHIILKVYNNRPTFMDRELLSREEEDLFEDTFSREAKEFGYRNLNHASIVLAEKYDRV